MHSDGDGSNPGLGDATKEREDAEDAKDEDDEKEPRGHVRAELDVPTELRADREAELEDEASLSLFAKPLSLVL